MSDFDDLAAVATGMPGLIVKKDNFYTVKDKAGEIRVTDPLTGGQKGSKLARFSLIPADWLWALAEHYGIGAQKYEDNNWRKSYKWSLSLDAHSRHLSQWLQGEKTDAETGSHHLIAAAWHLIALWWFEQHGKGTDDLR